MSKRDNFPTKSDSDPETKKPKLAGSDFQIKRMYRPAPEQRPNSPEPGPSSAPSDPALQKQYNPELERIMQCFGPLQTESYLQTCFSADLEDSTSATTSSTNMDTGESQSTLETVEEDMDVDMETTPESSRSSTPPASTSKEHNYRQFYRTHRSRRDE